MGAPAAIRTLLECAGWTIGDGGAVTLAYGASPPGRTGPVLLVLPPGAGTVARAAALAEGADDVAPDDCGPSELLARLDALRRRAGPPPLRMGDLAIDPLGRRALRQGRDLALLPREYALLSHLAGAAGRPVSRRALLRDVWKLRIEPGTNVVEVHVSRLRAKLDRGFATPLLHTIRGRGYALTERAPGD